MPLLNHVMKLGDYVDNRSKSSITTISFVLVAVLGLVDYLTGSELAFSIFYFLPIYLVASFVGQRTGIAVSVMSALVWFVADEASGIASSHPLIPLWNVAVRLWFFLIIVYILTSLREALRRENAAARKDYLTGVANSRAFYERVAAEIERARRYGHRLTLVYMDVDNFKQVNDQFGHSAGDELLCVVADTLQRNMRASDTVARLGGDEFALLLPETDYKAARTVIEKANDRLLLEAAHRKLPITFSFGAITCDGSPPGADQLIKAADSLMYASKQSGKNTIRHETLGEQTAIVA